MTICDVVHWAYAHKAGMYPFLKSNKIYFVRLLCLNDTLHKRKDKKNEQKTRIVPKNGEMRRFFKK